MAMRAGVRDEIPVKEGSEAFAGKRCALDGCPPLACHGSRNRPPATRLLHRSPRSSCRSARSRKQAHVVPPVARDLEGDHLRGLTVPRRVGGAPGPVGTGQKPSGTPHGTQFGSCPARPFPVAQRCHAKDTTPCRENGYMSKDISSTQVYRSRLEPPGRHGPRFRPSLGFEPRRHTRRP